MDTLDLTALERCLATLERAHARLVVTSPTDDDHDLFRAACVKEFELILEIVVKLLRKVLREYVTSTRELANLSFRNTLGLAAQHGLLRPADVDRWTLHRDNCNSEVYEYGTLFAEQTIRSLPDFINDAEAILASLRKHTVVVLDLNPRYVAMLHDLMAWHLPAEVVVWAYGSRVNGNNHEGSDLDLVLRTPDLQALPPGVISRFREALTDSNLPIFVDVHDWATLPASFHPRILARYEVLRSGATVAATV